MILVIVVRARNINVAITQVENQIENILDFSESLKGKEITYEFEDLLPQLAELQSQLVFEGIKTLVGGGVGTDLLIIKYLPGESPRKHGDVDLYVPIRLRGKTLDWMRRRGYEVDKHSLRNAMHAIVRINRIKYDLFSIEGNPSNAYVPNVSHAAILARQRIGTDIEWGTTINVHPDIVEYQDRSYLVMDASSQLSLLSNLSPLLVNKRDLGLLKKLSTEIGS